ncbi:DUF368 domain-containing protein [bacterium]|nr:DUF368 domain-containing protein [bacterium]
MFKAKEHIVLFFKGVAMGAANVIPGVSGGTIAFISGIYDTLIQSLKRMDLHALKLLFSFKIKELANYINLSFLVFLFSGVGLSIVTLGKLLKWLFEMYPIPVWAFFFGLIVASVYSVGKTIKKWNMSAIGGILVGTAVAVSLSFLKPASENANAVYLVICGVVAICSMLLPGLSGSFVLILMGNYELIMLTAIPEGNLQVIAPVGLGAIIGFIALSHFISFMLKKYELSTIGTLTGFILGSLLIIWPWKNAIYLTDDSGQFLLKEGKKIVMGYESFLPSFNNSENLIALLLIFLGMAMVLILDKYGSKPQNS